MERTRLKGELAQRLNPPSLALAPLILALVLAGCAGSGPQRQQLSPATSRPQHQDPHDALLTLADVRALRDAPQGLRALPDAARAFEAEAATHRAGEAGSCGSVSRLGLPPPADRAIVVFGSDSGSTGITHWVLRLDPGDAQKVMAAFRGAMRPGCSPVEVKEPSGPQASQFLGEVPLALLGDDRLAFSVRLRDGHNTRYVMAAAVRSGDNIALVYVGEPDSISRALLSDLAVAAGEKLAKLG
jgi:hypothetical protein